jgi:hypothetical protein
MGFYALRDILLLAFWIREGEIGFFIPAAGRVGGGVRLCHTAFTGSTIKLSKVIS